MKLLTISLLVLVPGDEMMTVNAPADTAANSRTAGEMMRTTSAPLMADATMMTRDLRTPAETMMTTISEPLTAAETMVTIMRAVLTVDVVVVIMTTMINEAAMVKRSAKSPAMAAAQPMVDSRRALKYPAGLVEAPERMSQRLVVVTVVRTPRATTAPKDMVGPIVRNLVVGVTVDRCSKRATAPVAMADKAVMRITQVVSAEIADEVTTTTRCLEALVEMMTTIEGAKDTADNDVEAMIEMRIRAVMATKRSESHKTWG